MTHPSRPASWQQHPAMGMGSKLDRQWGYGDINLRVIQSYIIYIYIYLFIYLYRWSIYIVFKMHQADIYNLTAIVSIHGVIWQLQACIQLKSNLHRPVMSSLVIRWHGGRLLMAILQCKMGNDSDFYGMGRVWYQTLGPINIFHFWHVRGIFVHVSFMHVGVRIWCNTTIKNISYIYIYVWCKPPISRSSQQSPLGAWAHRGVVKLFSCHRAEGIWKQHVYQTEQP
jgi:hypothetical protein